MMRRAVPLLFVLLCCAAPRAGAAEAPWNLPELMRALAAHPGGVADFTETKTLALLDHPLRSSGVLRYAAPDFLEMRTVAPRPQDLVLMGDRVVLELDGQQHTFDLRDHPRAAVLIETIRATLAGDAAALLRHDRVELEGTRAHWTLRLRPRDTGADVRAVRVSGHGGQIERIAVTEANGDHALLRIRPRPAR